MVKTTIIQKSFSCKDKERNVGLENEVGEGPAEFETAVSALGFGKFNIILFFILIPSQWSFIFDSSVMSYISPIARCDLDLSLNNRGFINAINPLGAITAGIFWGVLIDTLGRKKLILYGFLILGIVTIITSFSQSYTFLLTLKFISGAISGGVYIAQCTYYAEFHSMEHRSKMQLAMGFVSGAGLVAIPLLSAFILPLDFNVTLSNGYLVFHSWNLLIFSSSALPFIAGIIYIFLPESPKYLMTSGNDKKALSVFKKIYEINTGKSQDSYPIKQLISEEKGTDYIGNKDNCSLINYIKNGWYQISPLFSKKYFSKLILVTIIEFLLLNLNTIRAWLPQIFQAIHEYQSTHNGMTAQLCSMLDTLSMVTNVSSTSVHVCNVNTENSLSVYLNSMINALVCMVCYAMAGTLINLVGKKMLLPALGIISSATILTTYLSQNTATTLALTSLHLASVGISCDIIMTVIVVIFPTTLRATAISTVLLIGRSGAIIGNVLFPILLEVGCAPPFFTLGGIAIIATVLCLFLPSTDNKSLK